MISLSAFYLARVVELLGPHHFIFEIRQILEPGEGFIVVDLKEKKDNTVSINLGRNFIIGKYLPTFERWKVIATQPKLGELIIVQYE